MKKVSKAILIGVAVLIALVAVLLLGLNLYVQSPGSQARIQEELSKALRLPLKITNTSVTPWSDLRITGISIPDGDANFLEATSFTARYRLLPLLSGKLIITEMRVDNPKLIWMQNVEGSWTLPGSKEAAAVAAAQPPGEAPPGAEKSPEEKLPKPPMPKKAKAAAPKNFPVVIDRFDVKDGAIELFDKDRKHVATFSGVNITYTKLTAEQVEGTATVGKATWADGLTLENATTPFSYSSEDHALSLPDIVATFAGGTLRGRYLSRAEGEHTVFNGAAKFERADLNKLFAQSGGEAGLASGELDGSFDLRGQSDRKEKLTGTGHFALRDGRFHQLGFFQTIGEIFNIRSLTDFRVSEGEADVHLSGQKVVVEKIVLASSELQVSADGTIHLDKKVDLKAKLVAEDSLLKAIPSIFTDNFVPAENGRRGIAFNITGTTDKLRTDLVERMKTQTINNQLSGFLSLFGNNDKKEDDKKKKEEEERRKQEKKEKRKKDKDKSAAARDEPATAGAPQAPATPPNP